MLRLKMRDVLNDIIQSRIMGHRLLAVLIDPDKMERADVEGLFVQIHASEVTHIFVGGSEVAREQSQLITTKISEMTHLPIVLFPGDVDQISESADALLFLSLISGRNPDYLIGKHVEAISKLRNSELEIIPTGYILIENGKETTVEKVSKTAPIPLNNNQEIIDTAKAGELLGMKMIYLEAGSGAMNSVNSDIISEVKKDLKIPLIVGGGIKTSEQLENAFEAGADMVVVGTAFEENPNFFQQIENKSKEKRMTSN